MVLMASDHPGREAWGEFMAERDIAHILADQKHKYVRKEAEAAVTLSAHHL